MHWKLPLVLCLCLIGYSHCQSTASDDSVTTAGDSAATDDSAVTTPAPLGAADPVVLTTAADPGAAAVPAETTAAVAAGPADVTTAAAGVAGVVDSGAVTTADTGVAVAEITTEAAAEITTEAAAELTTEAAAELTTQPDLIAPKGEDEAPASPTPKPTEPETTMEITTETPTTETATTTTTLSAIEPSTAAKAPAATEETTEAPAPTLIAPPGEADTPKPAPAITQQAEVTTAADEVTTEAPTTTTAAPETTTQPWSGEPCETPNVLDQVERHYTATVGKQAINDGKLKKTWYRVEYEGEPAIVTSQPIKPDQCGTDIPFHLDLKGDTLPAKDSNKTYDICAAVPSKHGVVPCTERQPIEIKNCGDKYVYYLSPLTWQPKPGSKLGICIQKPGEIVPLQYLAMSEEETDQLDVPVTSVDDVSKEQLDGIVTLELKYPAKLADDKTDTSFLRELDMKYRPMVAQALNGLPKATAAAPSELTTAEQIVKKKEKNVAGAPPADSSPANSSPGDSGGGPAAAPEDKPKIPSNLDTDASGKGPRAAPLVGNPRFRFRRDTSRVKRETDHAYKSDDVHYVGPTPRIKHGVLQQAVYVDDPETTAVDGDQLLAAVQSLNKSGELGNAMNLKVLKIYKGLPHDIQPIVAPVPAKSVWKQHEGVFITIIVLLLLLLLILLIGCCCIKCRKRRGSWTANPPTKTKGKKGKPSSPSKRPLTSHESPYPDDEIKKDEANMTERENPAYTPNGSGGHIAKPNNDDEQGWIVPYEELKNVERMRPEVQDTRF